MANRRMFSMDVVDTDKFLDMPLTTQALYFHFGMRADDDGFLPAPKSVARTVGCSTDDIRILISKNYIIPLEDGVVVITDWNINNWIRTDRKQETRFKDLKDQLTLCDGVYKLPSVCLENSVQPDVNQATTKCQPDANQATTKCHTQYSIGKYSIDKNNINTICSELQEKKGTGIKIPLVDGTYYDVPEDKIPLWKQAYPAVNIDQELKKIIAWCDANPTKRKTRRGVTKFINSWLDRSQNQGRGTNGQQTGVHSGENKQGYIDSYI